MFIKFLFSVLLLAPLSVFADTSKIESLEKQRWEDIKTHNWKDVDSLVAPYFQAAFFDGVRNKEQFMTEVKVVDIGDYTLSNFKITEGPGVSVATYDIDVSETIEGKRIFSKATRLSVWQNTNGKWQLIAHANLIPVPSSSTSKK
jgi:hypothetical protein